MRFSAIVLADLAAVKGMPARSINKPMQKQLERLGPQVNDIVYTGRQIKQMKLQGIDTSTFMVYDPIIDDPAIAKATLAQEHYGEWTERDDDGKFVVAWSMYPGYPYPIETRYAIELMNKDLGCMKLIEVSREDLAATRWQTGLMFLWEDRTYGGCWSILGQSSSGEPHNADFYGMSETGAPHSWQPIGLASDCAGWSVATIQHEVLHALGLQHEHNRPDRDNYLNVQLGNSFLPFQFFRFESEHWEDTGNPFELESVMTYCSMCSSRNGSPVAALWDGTLFDAGKRITTTDALQVQEKYCNTEPNFVKKDHLQCPTADQFGYERPVFTDRLCDNFKDCPGGEDEDGTFAPCKPVANASNGCCSSFILQKHDLEFVYKEDLGWYTSSHIHFQRLLKSGGSWYVTDEYDDSNYFVYDSDDNGCPSISSDSVGLKCKVDGPVWEDVCQTVTCSGTNEVCINLFDGHRCICPEGTKARQDENNQQQCDELPIQDECSLGIHTCDPEGGVCTDTKYGYTCSCEANFIEDDKDNSKCSACCKIIKITEGSQTYTCHRSEDKSVDLRYQCEGYEYDLGYLDSLGGWLIGRDIGNYNVTYIHKSVPVSARPDCYLPVDWFDDIIVNCVEFEKSTSSVDLGDTSDPSKISTTDEKTTSTTTATTMSTTTSTTTIKSTTEKTTPTPEYEVLHGANYFKIACLFQFEFVVPQIGRQSQPSALHNLTTTLLRNFTYGDGAYGNHVRLFLNFNAEDQNSFIFDESVNGQLIYFTLTGLAKNISVIEPAYSNIIKDILSANIQRYQALELFAGVTLAQINLQNMQLCDPIEMSNECDADFKGFGVSTCVFSHRTKALTAKLMLPAEDGSLEDTQCRPSLIEANRENLFSRITFNLSDDDCNFLPVRNETHNIYKATILYKDGVANDVVSREETVKLDYECAIRTSYLVSGGGFTPMVASVVVVVPSSEEFFEINMKVMNNGNILANGGTVSVSDVLTVSGGLEVPATYFVSSLENCWATPSADKDDSLKFQMVSNRCWIDGDLLAPFADDFKNGQSRCEFSFSPFTFADSASNFIYLHCEIFVCDTRLYDCSPQCGQKRRRRDVESNLKSTMSLGPLNVKSKLKSVDHISSGFSTQNVNYFIGIFCILQVLTHRI